ncbi:AI-2E family transporter [Acetobacter aceti]|uniref:AI-2E family transporter n=1 Tax=Acetobacter aceti TaxID=435 RepID=A0A6S6PK76_ACEAC|nr:AI-2E family transporter [Acetobacter aceti]BCI68238.1 AI-2E family transporter [Acetobacter aceti]
MPHDMDESVSSGASPDVKAGADSGAQRATLPPSVLASEPDEEAAAERAQQARMHEAVRRARLSVNQVCLIILTILAILYTLKFAASIVLPMVMAVVTNLMLVTPMRVISHWIKLPRPIIAFLLIGSVFGGFTAVGMAVSVPAAGWLSQLPQEITLVQSHLAILNDPIHFLESTGLRIQKLLGVPADPHAPGVASGIMPLGSSLLLGTQAFMGQLFTFFIMLFFLLAQGDSLLRRFVEIMPTFNDKRRAVQISSHIERNISLYLATITMMNVFVGIANTVQCWMLGMPTPLLWGVVAFALNYIPIIGPCTGIVIYFCVGLLSFPTVVQALLPPAVYLCIHLLEGETITPMLLARRFTLNPVLVMASLLFWDWMWGITGAFLSVPMLAVFKIICDHVDYLTPIGHMIGGPGAMPDRHDLHHEATELHPGTHASS